MSGQRASGTVVGSLARAYTSALLLIVNLALFGILVIFFAARGAKLSPPWDGPAVVTVVLTVATVVLAAVGIGVALLAVWGYATLREHAGNIAKVEAVKAAAEAADARVQAMLREWGRGGPPPPDGQGVAQAYEREP
jgi:hypothetical protein